MDIHYASTTYIFDLHSVSEPRTLLHWHEKLETWLPPGGHVEKNETPLEAAIREIREETGIETLEFIHNGDEIGPIDERAEYLMLPHYLIKEKIAEDHYHLDWIFYAIVDSASIELDEGEFEFNWFTIDEIKKLHTTRIFDNVRDLALKGFVKFKENYSEVNYP